MSSATWIKTSAVAALVVIATVVTVVALSGGSDAPSTEQAGADDQGGSSSSDQVAEPTAPDEVLPIDREPTDDELHGSTLLFPWTVTATKTSTLTPPPDPIQPMDVGTTYSIPLDPEGACNNTTGECTDLMTEPHFPMFGWIATEPVKGHAWKMSGDSWTADIVGYYVSADYAQAAKCVYSWNEVWDVVVTDAIFDAGLWYATGFEGTMTRTEQLDQAHSSGRINDYCPPYKSSDEWAVRSERTLTPGVNTPS
jgi:hypothetical protein